MVLAVGVGRPSKTSVHLRNLVCAVALGVPTDALVRRLGHSYMTPTLALLSIATQYVIQYWAPECKADDQQRITPSGPRYELFCNVQTRRKDIKVEAAESFVACVDACGALAGCFGVDFDKLTKQCCFKSEAMTETTEGAANNDVDSATIVFPVCDPKELCDAVDKKICTINSEPVQFFCKKGTWAENLRSSPGVSIKDCAKQCQEEPKCQGVDFVPSVKTCYLKSQYINPPKTDNESVNCMVPVKARA